MAQEGIRECQGNYDEIFSFGILEVAVLIIYILFIKLGEDGGTKGGIRGQE